MLIGLYNSSRTRVQPFFKAVYGRDPGGSSWLPGLLALAPNRVSFPRPDLLEHPGSLHPTNVDIEKKLLPPEEFLRWLLQHPERMKWPNGGRARFETETQRWREMLMGRQDLSSQHEDLRAEIRSSDREEALRLGLQELTKHGAAGSHRKWWAFEGRTSVDCYLESERVRIYIEGKRTDVLSPSTDWYPYRNQLLRNLESAREDAGRTPFACLLIAEQRLPALPPTVLEAGLPHLSESDRDGLLKHFLGCITWREACEATGVDYDQLPMTT